MTLKENNIICLVVEPYDKPSLQILDCNAFEIFFGTDFFRTDFLDKNSKVAITYDENARENKKGCSITTNSGKYFGKIVITSLTKNGTDYSDLTLYNLKEVLEKTNLVI